MRNSDSHIIKNASFNFLFSGNINGMQLQEEVAGWCRNELGPAFNAALAEFDQEEHMIVIDSLKLDLELGETVDWKKELADQITWQLREKIHSKIQQGGTEVIVKPPSLSFSEALLYLLKFGILPWNAPIKSGNDFRTELRVWVKTISSSELKKLIDGLEDINQIRRLIRLLDDRELKPVIAPALLRHESLSITRADIEHPGIELFLAVFLDEPIDKVSSFFGDVQFIITLFTEEKPLQASLFKDFEGMLFQEVIACRKPGLLLSAFSRWMKEVKPDYDGQFHHINLKLIRNIELQKVIRNLQPSILDKRASAASKVSGLKGKVSTDRENEAELLEELKEGTYISNAGAVIIAPFLPALFSRTGLLKDGSATDGPTALSLLHYCISGQKFPLEFELLLPKILCGILPETIVETVMLSDKQLIREADEMLASVIEYWSVLKDTSADGLREAFLQRNGKLSFADNEWLLQVEQKPYDMLLQHLPWNISMIRLTWMNNILRTQWIL